MFKSIISANEREGFGLRGRACASGFYSVRLCEKKLFFKVIWTVYRIPGFDCFNEAAGLLCVLNSSIVFGICHSSLFFYQVRCRRTETIGFIATALAAAQRPSAADSSQAKAAPRWLRFSARVPCLLRVHSRFRAAHRPVCFSVWTYIGKDRKSPSELWMFFKFDFLTWRAPWVEKKNQLEVFLH